MEQTEAAVWDRVTAKNGFSPERALLPERLAMLIAQEKGSADACRQLAARLSGADAAYLRRLRAQAENRVRQLNALYFLFCGLKPKIRGERVPFHADRCDALREAYLSMHAQQNRLRKTAEEFPTCADTLNDLAVQLQQSMQTLCRILQHCM